MTSKSIYHYVYRITNLVEQKHYYGKRSSKVPPKQDLGKKYFSSSTDKQFMADQKAHPENYKYKVVALFQTAKEACALEAKLHSKFGIGQNKSFYNKAKQTSTGFDTTGLVAVIDKNCVHYSVKKDDPLYLNGTYTPVAKNRVSAKDKSGASLTVDINDNRLKSGELIGVNAGRKMSELEKDRRRDAALKRKNSQKPSTYTCYFWEITFPTGETEIVSGLTNFCSSHNICPRSMRNLAYGKRKFYMGYGCKRLNLVDQQKSR